MTGQQTTTAADGTGSATAPILMAARDGGGDSGATRELRVYQRRWLMLVMFVIYSGK